MQEQPSNRFRAKVPCDRVSLGKIFLRALEYGTSERLARRTRQPNPYLLITPGMTQSSSKSRFAAVIAVVPVVS